MWHALILCAKIVIALSLNIEQTHIEWNVNNTESFLFTIQTEEAELTLQITSDSTFVYGMLNRKCYQTDFLSIFITFRLYHHSIQ